MLGIAWGNADGYLTTRTMLLRYDGGSLSDLIGLHPVEFTHPDDLPSVIPPLREMQEGRINNYRVEKRYVTLKGNTIWVAVNVSCEKDEKGNIT